MWQRASRVAVIVAWVMLASGARSQGMLKWTTIATGLEITSASFPHRPGAVTSMKVTAIRVDPRSYRLRVTDLLTLRMAPSTSSGRPTGARFEIPSLRALALARPDVLVGINGGFITSYAFPRPVGLVISNGLTISAESPLKLLSGLVCVHRTTGAIQIAFQIPGAGAPD